MFTSSSSRRKTNSERRDSDRDSPKSSRDKDKNKDKERDRDKDKDKEKKHRPRYSQRIPSSSSRERERERDRDSSPRRDRRTESLNSPSRSDRKMSLVPEMERRPSIVSPRISSYPSFSKAHSKEAVGSRDHVLNTRPSLYTPDPTDVGTEPRGKDSSFFRHPVPNDDGVGPPSPPLTTTEPDLRRTRSERPFRTTPSNIRIVSPPRTGRESLDDGSQVKAGPNRPTSSSSSSVLPKRQDTGLGSDISNRTQSVRSDAARRTRLSGGNTDMSSVTDSQRKPDVQSKTKSQVTSNISHSTIESEATTVPPVRKSSRAASVAPLDVQSSPRSAPDSSPRTPTPNESNFPSAPLSAKRRSSGIDVLSSSGFPSPYSTQSTNLDAPGFPPPPPPPAPIPADVPRVDYLLQNGGLPYVVPRRFVSVISPATPFSAQYPSFASPRGYGPQHTDVRAMFSPFQAVLDDYLSVMSKNGSLAVATGYRSVARRLLDRLEAVFNRNISSENCQCIMCKNTTTSEASKDEDTGLSWGEILESVSGRRELPPWPPFAMSSDAPSLASVTEAPMQKLDMDIPPEYREHYIRQSKKTKDVVQAWLSSQPEVPSSPPQEVDDETLVFAMVTHLEPENRKLFTALLRGMSSLPGSRAPTPAAKAEKSELVKRTSLALQRLYRLPHPPRDAECAMYLLKNPQVHGMLATLAAVSNGEWEVLISGRFDGFLWSGAESTADSRMASRGVTPAATPGDTSRIGTPFSTRGSSRGPTPAQGSGFGAPVQMDEDMEIAVLAEVEREIYAGMDALEDAFELLHCKAEQVREALRVRNAGLSMSASARRGSVSMGPEAIRGTPSVTQGIWDAVGKEDEEWIDDGKSDIRPDDSASNVSRNRRRRRHRDKDRRTPAPVEEEDEGSSLTEDFTPRRR